MYEISFKTILGTKSFVDSNKKRNFAADNINDLNMTIVSTRDFRANQTKYLEMVDQGEHVVLRSRRGRYRLTAMPVEPIAPKRDVTAEVCQAIKDWKEYLETGKSDKFRPAEDLIDELRNL